MTTQVQAADFYNRRRRDKRYARLGAGFPEGRNILSAGAAIPTPLTADESVDGGTIVFEIEFINGVYPDGIVYSTGSHNVELTTAGSLNLNTVGPNIEFDMTVNTPASGVHTVVSYVDVRTVGTGLYVLHLDGIEIAREETGGFTEWAVDAGTWAYLDATTDFGLASDLHVFPGFRPATLLG